MKTWLVALCFLAALGCGSKGGSGGGSSSFAPISSGTTSPTTSTTTGSTNPVQQGYGGVWDVSGTDPVRGAFTGTAEVVATTSGYTVKRLVTFASKTAAGEQVLWAWNASAKEEAGGLRVDATLRRAHVWKRAGTTARTAADRQPLPLTALFLAPSGGAVGGVSIGTSMKATFSGSSGNGPTETWTRSSTQAPLFPIVSEKSIPADPPISASVKQGLFSTYASFHALAEVQPYVARPEFQAAVHEVTLDSTALDFYRQKGPGFVVLVDAVSDDIAVAEESNRAHAFGRKLVEKAKLFDQDARTTNSDANGMITAVDLTASPPRHDFPQSPVLYTGVWALANYYRYQATSDPEALDNLVRATTGAVICVDISTDKTQFARGVDFLVNAQPGQVGPPGGKYGWVAGTGTYANLMWMYGGNNDMLHGIETCFSVAADVLPAGHPLRAQVGAQATSLLTNVKDAQSGNHEINLAYAAWKTTGDPAMQKRYESALGFKNVLQKLYLQQGGELTCYQGTADWSGHHLGMLTLLELSLLGGQNPTADERSWRDAASASIKTGFGACGLYREGLVVAFAAANHVPGATDLAKGVLNEIPYPKAYGDVDVDFTVSDDFCLSPYPSMPWKLDWTTNTAARLQSLRSYPYFYRGCETNYWNRSPLSYSGGPDKDQEPGQDYLVAYWLLRSAGVISAQD